MRTNHAVFRYTDTIQRTDIAEYKQAIVYCCLERRLPIRHPYPSLHTIGHVAQPQWPYPKGKPVVGRFCCWTHLHCVPVAHGFVVLHTIEDDHFAGQHTRLLAILTTRTHSCCCSEHVAEQGTLRCWRVERSCVDNDIPKASLWTSR